MSAHLKNPLVWLHGLLSAFIGGSVIVVADVVVDALDGPLHLNLKKLGAKALVSGLVFAAAYLRKSPLPELEVK